MAQQRSDSLPTDSKVVLFGSNKVLFDTAKFPQMMVSLNPGTPTFYLQENLYFERIYFHGTAVHTMSWLHFGRRYRRS